MKQPKSGLTATKSQLVEAPIINELPTHGYYLVSQRVGDAFKDGLKLK